MNLRAFSASIVVVVVVVVVVAEHDNSIVDKCRASLREPSPPRRHRTEKSESRVRLFPFLLSKTNKRLTAVSSDARPLMLVGKHSSFARTRAKGHSVSRVRENFSEISLVSCCYCNLRFLIAFLTLISPSLPSEPLLESDVSYLCVLFRLLSSSDMYLTCLSGLLAAA